MVIYHKIYLAIYVIYGYIYLYNMLALSIPEEGGGPRKCGNKNTVIGNNMVGFCIVWSLYEYILYGYRGVCYLYIYHIVHDIVPSYLSRPCSLITVSENYLIYITWPFWIYLNCMIYFQIRSNLSFSIHLSDIFNLSQSVNLLTPIWSDFIPC